MRQRLPLARITFLTLLVLFLGGPAIFGLDPWDAFPDSGDTALLVLCAAALCLGGALLLAGRSFRLFRRAALCAVRMLLHLSFASHPAAPVQNCPFRSLTPLRI